MGIDWGKVWGTAATAATGNPYFGMAVNTGFNWVHEDKGTEDKPKTNNIGDLASIGMQAYAAKKSRKQQAQATQNTGKLDLGYLRQEAENNGFNPLTVLQSTGGAGSTKSSNAGLLASSQFWATYADGLGELNNRQYEQGLINAERNAKKLNYETTGIDGLNNVALFQTVKDPTGVFKDFLIVNPELLDMSANQIRSSITVLAGEYSLQHGLPISEAKQLFQKLFAGNAVVDKITGLIYGTDELAQKEKQKDPDILKTGSFWQRVETNYTREGIPIPKIIKLMIDKNK